MSDYSDKLKNSQEWQTLRWEIIHKHNGACYDCGRKDVPLEIHHCAYLPGKEPWECGEDLLVPLDRDCHERRQQFENMARIALGRIFRLKPVAWVEIEAWRLAAEAAQLQTLRNNTNDWSEAFT
jgi:hypothetical protein